MAKARPENETIFKNKTESDERKMEEAKAKLVA